MTEGPYYIVYEGTNQRWLLQGNNPKVYDTEEIAKAEIVRSDDRIGGLQFKNQRKSVPISVEEYDEKYSKFVGFNPRTEVVTEAI